MRRRLYFDYSLAENSYIIQENGNTIFCINGDTLRFVSLEFYNGVYAGNKSTSIDFENKIVDDSSDPLKKGRYIFDWIKEIFVSVEQELPELEQSDSKSNEQVEDKVKPNDEILATHESRKLIPLFDWPACAGDGFYFDQESVPFDYIETDNQDADYAVRISGESMEPIIKDGSVVMVKKVDVLSNGDIGIFNFNGETMCKRYCIDAAGTVLKPENRSGDFHIIDTLKGECVIQGKVLL